MSHQKISKNNTEMIVVRETKKNLTDTRMKTKRSERVYGKIEENGEYVKRTVNHNYDDDTF